MSDVQLLDLRDRGYRANVSNGQAVPGVYGQPLHVAFLRRLGERAKRSRVVRMMRILAGVELHRVGTELARDAHGRPCRIDEQTRTDAGAAQPGECSRDVPGSPGQVEPALRRHLFPTLGDEG